MLRNIGKRYNREWIFRGVDAEFGEAESCVILGANGSGKSTLLQLIAGAYIPTEGQVEYRFGGTVTEQENLYRSVSIAAPYLELMEEFTLRETIVFHNRFKNWRGGLNNEQVLEISGLQSSAGKALRNFSSGMKQRVRLLLAILSDTPVLLLDEPCSNLDAAAVNWYQELVKNHRDNRVIIVCSNQQEEEYFFCTQKLLVENFKQ
ncbi:MAG: ABC transporter [Bacteroidetes bacterium]|nr:MAG: ABC transporter [Bacteroidota bacterium]